MIGWLWLRHGQRPGLMIGVGCVVAGAGLVLVLDVVTGRRPRPVGVLWALLAMLGVATYFVLSAQEGNGLPPIVLAAAGMVVGAVALLLLGAGRTAGHVVVHRPGDVRRHQVPWWVAVLGLGVVTAAVAYTTGIAAGRRLGLAAGLVRRAQRGAVRARLRLAVPGRGAAGRCSSLGGALILAGVVLVKLGEPRHP